jgi:phosphoribosylanthranilate isomerase
LAVKMGRSEEQMSLKIKICGITNLADARVAVEAGADLLGFVFYDQSARCVGMKEAAEIIGALPPFVAKVGVFVNAPAAIVWRAIRECGLTMAQFHGNESPEYCAQFGVMTMKAVRMRDAESLDSLPAYKTDAWLLDTYAADKPGGTGATFNWDLAVEAQKLGQPIFLAGGLTAENVAAAVRHVRPFGVDVSSGVESGPGKKDAGKVRAFVAAARKA